MVLDSPQRLKALANDTRARILTILEDGPASAKQLSALLEMSHGKVGHHVKVLRDAALIEVVEERQVRALTERFYGLTYDRLSIADSASDRLRFIFSQAAREARPGADQPLDPPATYMTVRMSSQQASDFHGRLMSLVEEFRDSGDQDEEHVYGLATALFLTDTPSRGSRT